MEWAPRQAAQLQELLHQRPEAARRPSVLLALLLGAADPFQLGDALAAAVLPLHGLARLLLTPAVPAPDPTIQAAWSRLAPTSAAAADLFVACGAGAPSPSDRAVARRAIHQALQHTVAAWDHAIDTLQSVGAPSRLVDGLRQSQAFLTDVASMHAAFGPAPSPPDPRCAPAGLDWLAPPSRLQLLVEHQAWGFPEAPAPLSETRWLRLRAHLALHAAGIDQTAHLRALFDARPRELPRWYDQWDGIPPDTDSLAAWLELAHAVGAPVPQQWGDALTRLHGPSPTWLSDTPPQWGGPDCAGVRARLTRALILHPDLHHLDVLHANLADLLAHAPGSRSWHYPPARALGFALELAADLRRCPLPLPPSMAAWIDTAVAAAETCLLGPSPPPGPMATASLAAGLHAVNPTSVAISPALRYLERTQRPDGAWEGEPAFVIPGRPPHPQSHLRSPTYTTVMCVAGILQAGQE